MQARILTSPSGPTGGEASTKDIGPTTVERRLHQVQAQRDIPRIEPPGGSPTVTGVEAYERHLQRLETDAAYRDGFDHGRDGGETDGNPWPNHADEHNAWNTGWRVGTVARSFNEARDDMKRELQRMMNAGELD